VLDHAEVSPDSRPSFAQIGILNLWLIQALNRTKPGEK